MKLLLLLGFLIPYIFIGEYLDFNHGTILGYTAFIIWFIISTWILRKDKNILFVILGNVLCYSSSFLCLNWYNNQEWDYYFKPLSSFLLLNVVTVIFFVLQFIIVFMGRKK